MHHVKYKCVENCKTCPAHYFLTQPKARFIEFPFQHVIDHFCRFYGFPLHFDYIFIMYSERSTHYVHPVQCVHIAYRQLHVKVSAKFVFFQL